MPSEPLTFVQEELPVGALADNLHRIASAYKEHWVAHVMAASVRLRQFAKSDAALRAELAASVDQVGYLQERVRVLEARLAAVTEPGAHHTGSRTRPRVGG